MCVFGVSLNLLPGVFYFPVIFSTDLHRSIGIGVFAQNFIPLHTVADIFNQNLKQNQQHKCVRAHTHTHIHTKKNRRNMKSPIANS